MKQKIHDIPIWDAFELKNCECPLCMIEKKIEDQFIDTIFNEMVMDVRLNPQLVEEYRFCKEHFEKLYKYPDKFGLAILSDRILYLEREALENFKKTKNSSKKSFKDLFNFKKSNNESCIAEKKCLICTRNNETMELYIETLLDLWCKENKFKNLFSSSQGFCLKHFKELILKSENQIKNAELRENFQTIAFNLQEKNLERIHGELEWFITKFDYRFKDEPWKTSKDSLIRTLTKLIGNYNNLNTH